MPSRSDRKRRPPAPVGRRAGAPAGRTRKGWLQPYEQRRHKLLPWPAFIVRVLVNLGLGTMLIGGSLLVGMWGYHAFAGLSAIDSFLNSAMILSGMGPVAVMDTYQAKLFAGFYALYCGVTVLAAAGLIFAPLVHRLLHRFHADDDDEVGVDTPAPTGKNR